MTNVLRVFSSLTLVTALVVFASAFNAARAATAEEQHHKGAKRRQPGDE